MAMHVAEAANVHQDVEAHALSGVERTRHLVEASAILHPQGDNLVSLLPAQSLNHAANLPIGMMVVLIKERSGELDLERLLFQ